MPFGNYDELCETVENWLARDDFADEIADFIYLAEKQMSTMCRLRIQDVVEPGNFIADQDWIPAPADMIEPKMLRIMSDPIRVVDIVSNFKWNDVVNHKSTTEPSAAMHHGFKIYVGRTAQSNLGYELWYRGGFPRLGSNNPSNFILEQYPQAYLYGALANAGPFLGADERVPQWEAHAQLWFGELRKGEAKARTAGGRLRIRPDVIDGGRTAAGIRSWPF
jgi:hypothetical protein